MNSSFFFSCQSPVFDLCVRHEFKDFWYDLIPFDYHADHLERLRRKMKSGEGRRLAVPLDCALEYAGTVHYYLGHKHLYR